MTAKIRRVRAKGVLGQQERIVARAPADSSAPAQQPTRNPDETYAPALATLNDKDKLKHVIDAFEFLDGLDLHYCDNCDEEWPVFQMPWPQTGVTWVGPKAGRCETIERAGFRASHKISTSCSRCDGDSAYKKMYSEANGQHLGERHNAISALTWYESLLVARVHPVMSVVTLTATGVMCFAGHVCNYYVKVMEWVQGLPAVLRDKKWFLIKRRKSIKAGSTDTTQKKPTTANRYRLEAAIWELKKYLPKVYAGSVTLPDELDKFPCFGEQEMCEQEESVDLNGEVHILKDMFTLWYASGETSVAPRPCAAVLCRYTMDNLGQELRGSVAADTAWDLCCRMLSIRPEQNKLGTRDLAGLLVYWLEERHVPTEMAYTIYDGMEKEQKERRKTNVTVQDDQLMRCRWVRQSIHAELDAIREECAAIGEGIPIELEVDGEIAQNLQQPANAEAIEQATMLLQDLRVQGSTPAPTGAEAWDNDPEAWDNNDEAEDWAATALENPIASEVVDANQTEAPPLTKLGDTTAPATDAVPPGKPLVPPPEFGDRVRDTDKQAYWIPGAFPTIFQNQTGDLHNYFIKEPDMLTWGPHIMRSRGWHAQAHMTFAYWWLNMVQRSQVLSAKKWYVHMLSYGSLV